MYKSNQPKHNKQNGKYTERTKYTTGHLECIIIDLTLNGKQVTPAMGTYAYRAYLETLLNYDVSVKKSQLTSALYYKDTPGQMDETGSLPSEKTITYVTGGPKNGAYPKSTQKVMVPGSGNEGFAKRHTKWKASYHGRPHFC